MTRIVVKQLTWLTKQKPKSIDTDRYADGSRHRGRYTGNDAGCPGPSFSLLQSITGDHGWNDHDAKNQRHEGPHENVEKPWWRVWIDGHNSRENDNHAHHKET